MRKSKLNTCNRRIVFFLGYLIWFQSSQGLDIPEDTSWVESTFDYIKVGSSHSVKSPGGFILLGTAAGTAGALLLDNTLRTYAQEAGLIPEAWSQFGDQLGGTWGHWIIWSGISVHSMYKRHSHAEWIRNMEYATLSMVANGVVTDLIKRTFGRERPNNNDRRSFPSGHTSHSFTIATVVNEIYGPPVGRVAYLLAGLVAVSRIQDDKHYLSDVVFGAGLGTAIASGFAVPFRNGEVTDRITILIRPGIGIELTVWL